MGPLEDEPYLAPYHRAAERHGAGFQSLLWANPQTQALRFETLRQASDPSGKFLLDAGCGRADYLQYLLDRGVRPFSYIGIEAVEALASAAEEVAFHNSTLLRADFVKEPLRLFVGAEIIVFSGSLNTLDDGPFYDTIRHAYEAAGEALVFNFLASWNLAGRDYLRWHRKEVVQRYVREFCSSVRVIDGYLDGDCTICARK